jgi:hypothetical protein
MSRSITSASNTAAQASHVKMALLVDLDFDSGNIYLTNSDRTITYASNDYLGVGQFGGVTDVEESSILSASRVNLTLSGIDPALISTAFNEHYQGRAATLYAAFLDSTYTLIADPVVLFKGTMDNMNIKLGFEGVITLSIISRLDDWQKAKVRRYNNEDQQSKYAGDKGLEFAEQTAQGVLLKVT